MQFVNEACSRMSGGTPRSSKRLLPAGTVGTWVLDLTKRELSVLLLYFFRGGILVDV